MSGVFLSDGINDAEDQRAREAEENAKKREAGMVKVRAIDPMTNTMKNVWIKKDEATLEVEEEIARKKNLEKREAELGRKSRMLELIEKEKKLEKEEAKIAEMELKLKKDK